MLAAVYKPVICMPEGAERKPAAAADLAGSLAVAVVLSLLVLLTLSTGGPRLPARGSAGASGPLPAPTLAPPTLPVCGADRPGYLRGQVFGQLHRALDLYGEQLHCGVVLRPGAAGLRLLFQPAGGGLLLVIGVPAQPGQLPAREFSVTVTLADEGSGRFYSSAGVDRCWARFAPARTTMIAGELYCAGALPAVNRRGSVTLGDFAFAVPLATDES